MAEPARTRCRTCGKELWPPRRSGNVRKYCSRGCYRGREDRSHTRVSIRKQLASVPAYCVWCGTRFTLRSSTQVLCSAACSRLREPALRYARERAVAERERRKFRACAWCLAEFRPGKVTHVYCSAKCRQANARGVQRMRDAQKVSR